MSNATFTVALAQSDDGRDTSDFRAARRVIMHSDALKSAKLCSGDVVAVIKAEGKKDDVLPHFAVGILWPSLEILQGSLAISYSLLLTADLQEGNKVRIQALSQSGAVGTPSRWPSLRDISEAVSIRLKEIFDNRNISKRAHKISTEKGKQRNWLTLALRERLVDLKYLTPTQIVEIVYEGTRRKFAIESISVDTPTTQESTTQESVSLLTENLNSLAIQSRASIWTAGWNTSVVIVENEVKYSTEDSHKRDFEELSHSAAGDAYASVGGLDKTISQIRDLLEIPLTRPDLFRHLGLKPPRGILLHGPPGTGKTHLARAIAASTNSSVLVVNGPELSSAYHGETESKLRDVFKEAREKRPCIVVLDEIDALVPRREDGAGGEVEKRVVATLLTILDGMESDPADGSGGDRVIVIGTTNRPNAIDPALRRPGRFDREFEIGIPDAEARLSILNVLLANTPHSISQEHLHTVASRAHGYVGADLSAVIREAGTLAIKRWMANNLSRQNSTDFTGEQPVFPTLTLSDLLDSLPLVRPSAMRSLFVEFPPVRYSDVGGQSHVIQRLKEAVEWPLMHPEAFERLGVKPPKGVLLYGPPGCSKTVLARACACESGVNFVAVKGPELLNKFVGESERAVREIFRKARAASPSILFFDEIDALATSRTSTDSDVSGSHEGVLTSLLNEMDGVQELVGVTILAATNRPDVIDSALMRPGRLDRIIYVGPPDQVGREEILEIRTRKMSVDPQLSVQEIAMLTEGCSGAEITALCQEAALLTMQKNMDAPYVPHEAFVVAAKGIQRQITPEIIQRYKLWRDRSGLRDM